MRGRTLLLLVAAACDRGHHEAPAPQPPPVPQPAPAAVAPGAKCTLAANAPAHPAHRLVAIGDLHGDLGGARAALRAAGAIGDHDAWIGGDLVVVQTGDVLDRGDDESLIFELLDRLDHDARAQGGAVIQLLGNHELMNAAGDFRYVTAGGARDFGGDRAGALAPGGAWAKRLAAHDVVTIVDGNVLSHAGVLPAWADRIDATNLAARCWLDGQAGGPDHPPAVEDAQDGPVWTRSYGREDVDCATLAKTLQDLHAQRMIVGHTVQSAGISSSCDGALWRIDVGLAKEYGGPIQVLELDGEPRVIDGTR